MPRARKHKLRQRRQARPSEYELLFDDMAVRAALSEIQNAPERAKTPLPQDPPLPTPQEESCRPV